MTTIATKRAIGYTRVSTVDQAGEKHSSLDTQKAHIATYCQSNGLTLVTTLTDVFSGRRDDRPEYRRMVDMAMRGDMDVIIVQFLDRFGRNPREILSRIWALQERGVEVVATDEDIKEELVLLVRAGLAGAESKRNAERVRTTMSDAFEHKQSLGGKPPYGVRRVWRTNEAGELERVWEQDPDAVTAIRRMYDLFVNENAGYRTVANRLNEEGYPSPRGEQWSGPSVQWVVTSEALIGVGTYGRRGKGGLLVKRIEGFFPAILTREEWDALQARLAIRKESPRGRTHTSEYLLTGVARCGHCGGPMHGSTVTKPSGKQYRRYTCVKHSRSSAQCPYNNMHRVDELDAQILGYLGQWSKPDMVRELAAGGPDTSGLEQEIAGTGKRLEEIEREFARDYDRMNRGILDEEDFVRANASRKEERVRVKARHEELLQRFDGMRQQSAQMEAIPTKVREFLADVQNLTVQQNKARLQGLLKAVHVYKDGRIEVEWRS